MANEHIDEPGVNVQVVRLHFEYGDPTIMSRASHYSLWVATDDGQFATWREHIEAFIPISRVEELADFYVDPTEYFDD